MLRGDIKKILFYVMILKLDNFLSNKVLKLSDT
jgi:hypothetical protein